METETETKLTTDHDYSYNESGYTHDDDCRACLKATNLRHEFEQDRAEASGICRCGDVEFVHKPQTLGRIVRRSLFNAGYFLRYGVLGL